MATTIPLDGGTPAQTRAGAAAAQQVYAAEMLKLASNRYQLAPDLDRITFAKYREWYLKNISTTKRNYLREQSMLKQLGLYFDDDELFDIEHSAVIEWRTARANEVSAATVNRESALLKHVFSTAIPKYLATNPAAGLKLLRVQETEVRLLEPDEERALLSVSGPEDRAIIICALDTLQRLTSVASLKRAQDHGTYLTVLNPKVRGYKVPVSIRLRAALDSLPEEGPFYFPGVQGGTDQARRNRMIARFVVCLKLANLPTSRKDGGLSFHCLRHTGASRMLARGVDIKTVQQLGGWHNLDVLQRYLHPTDAHKRAAVELVSVIPT